MKIRDIKNNLAAYIASEKRRGHDASYLTELVEAYDRSIRINQIHDNRKKLINQNNKKIGSAVGFTKDRLILDNEELSKKIDLEKNELAELKEKIGSLMKRVGSLLESDVPELTYTVYEKKDSADTDLDISGEYECGKIELNQGSRISGHGFYYLIGDVALLELALINAAVKYASAHGIVPVSPPVMVKKEAITGTGYYDNHSDEIYKVDKDDLYLTATSEISMAALMMGKKFKKGELPLRYVGISNCFRREAGTYGRDDISIHRVHQFNKVELFSFTEMSCASSEFEKLVALKSGFLKNLNLPFRIRNIEARDLNRAASKKYDFEIYHRGMNRYIEVASISNCSNFQSDNLQIRGDEKEKIATLNGTLCAVPRLIMVLMERPHLIEDMLKPYRTAQK